MLLRNGTVLNQYPIRQLGGGVQSDITMANRNERRNIYTGITDLKSGIPNGHGSPSAWLLPLQPGGMSSINYAVLRFTPTADGLMGYPVIGSSSFAVQADATGSLITSGAGAAALSIAFANAQLIASLSGSGTSSLAVSAGATASGQGDMVAGATVAVTSSATILPTNDASPLRTASAAITITGTLTSYAVGSMAGSTLNGAAMSETSILAAMNAAPPAVNIKKVNDIAVNGVGSAGNPWGP